MFGVIPDKMEETHGVLPGTHVFDEDLRESVCVPSDSALDRT